LVKKLFADVDLPALLLDDLDMLIDTAALPKIHAYSFAPGDEIIERAEAGIGNRIP
jgi:hypothetical protein